MTPEEMATKLKEQYGDKALEVCETVYEALTVAYDIPGNPREVAAYKIKFWWPVLLELGYDA